MFLLRAHLTLGVTLYCLGEFAPARAHLEQSIVLYEPQQHHALVLLYGPDPGVICRGWAAPVLWLLGYSDQALQRSQEALTLARELSHSDSFAFALQLASVLHQCRREEQATQEQAEALITLSNKLEFPYFVALGTILQGWALVGQGSGEEGIMQIRQGLAVHRATGAEVGRSRWLALLVEAYEKVGQAEEGLAVVAEALSTMDKTGERFYVAELYRLKGELTLQRQSKVTSRRSKVSSPKLLAPSIQEVEAESYFLKAIEVSQKQQAKSLELRATMSLARLWQQQGKRHEAREKLAAVYNWFTEGFDTKDLQEAKALLEELG